MSENTDKKPFFTQLEARVIACLMEKQLTTPNNYPLTLNSLMLACNQKSNREPVMSLTEGQVGHTVNQLESRNLIGIDYGGRANHISHRVMNELMLDRKKQSILTVLMVRSPLTLSDIKARTNRMVEFTDTNEIYSLLTDMMQADVPLVVCIPKSTGSREDRFTHLLCGDEAIQLMLQQKQKQKLAVKEDFSTTQSDLEKRVEQLEAKVEKLMVLLNQ
jgi:uncharacterized protein YceH (UPF0502 family)